MLAGAAQRTAAVDPTAAVSGRGPSDAGGGAVVVAPVVPGAGAAGVCRRWHAPVARAHAEDVLPMLP